MQASPALTTGEASATLALIAASKIELEARTPAVCEALSSQLPSLHASHREGARALLDVKRSLFNGRLPKRSKLDQLMPHLDRRVGDDLAFLVDLRLKLEGAVATYPAAYARDIADGFEGALRVFEVPALRNGIRLTNPALFKRLTILEGEPGRASAKDRAVLATAMARYGWRASRKTSPLASFGRVAIARWGHERQPGSSIALTGTRTSTTPRLAVLETVAESLLRSFDDLAPEAPLLLNTSVVEEAGTYRWLSIRHDEPPAARTRGTHVTANRSTASAVALLSRLFAVGEGRPMTAGELRVRLVEVLGATDGRRVEALLDHAWRHQLLRLHTLAAGRSDRLDQCVAALRPDRRALVLPALEDYRTALSEHLEDPAMAVDAVVSALTRLLAVSGIEVPAEAFHPLAYLDCFVEAPAGGIDPAAAAPWLRGCEALLAAMPLLTSASPLARLRRAITSAFVSRFGSGGRCPAIEGFFTEFASEHPHLMGGGAWTTLSTAASMRPVEEVDPFRGQRQSLFGSLARVAASGQDVALTDAEFLRLVGPSAAEASEQPTSHMFFVQPFRGDSGSAVLNQVYPGYGSMLTRFMSEDDGSTSPLRRYLNQVVPSGDPVEIDGIFGFNANLHPRLTRRAMAIPPFCPDEAAGDVIELRDLVLCHCPETGSLSFVDVEGNRIDALYLGMLTPALLPAQVQLARAICLPSDSMQAIWMQIADHVALDANGDLRLPRIRIEGLVVVRRLLATRRACAPSPDTDDATFFSEFNAWADERQLPRSLFFQRQAVAALHAAEGPRTMPEMNWTRLAKPMPLDRGCPLAVRVLQRSLSASELDLVLTEALPLPEDDSFTYQGEPVVGELGVELSRVTH